jgi:hypothetical protein
MYKSMGRAPSFIHPSLESINTRRHNVARREKSSIHIDNMNIDVITIVSSI